MLLNDLCDKDFRKFLGEILWHRLTQLEKCADVLLLHLHLVSETKCLWGTKKNTSKKSEQQRFQRAQTLAVECAVTVVSSRKKKNVKEGGKNHLNLLLQSWKNKKKPMKEDKRSSARWKKWWWGIRGFCVNNRWRMTMMNDDDESKSKRFWKFSVPQTAWKWFRGEKWYYCYHCDCPPAHLFITLPVKAGNNGPKINEALAGTSQEWSGNIFPTVPSELFRFFIQRRTSL